MIGFQFGHIAYVHEFCWT